MKEKLSELIARCGIVADVAAAKETVWLNEKKTDTASALSCVALDLADVDDAAKRLERFAPFIRTAFPETEALGGLIESPLTEIPNMRARLNEQGAELSGRLFLKRDSDLPIAGSVKARGGIYEVLKHSEDLAAAAGLLDGAEDYSVFASKEFHDFFAKYSIHVGSTGNLGLSIGIMSAVLGYQVNVHMSADAKQWKKELLRSYGVNVIEYAADYSKAVEEGRKLAERDPMSYFVDDENSKTLFLGYAVAARRLKAQLAEQNIVVDAEHPLFVYIPCGVGGGPGGVCFGLHQEFGDDVNVFFVEPTQAPCMLLGLATGLQDKISVQDVGLTGLTAADGLAVGRASSFVGTAIGELLCGEFTVEDKRLYDYMRALLESENLFIEPSASASFQGAMMLKDTAYAEKAKNAIHIAWATGGRLVPAEEREKYRATYL
ncbi:MAG: D-serine ammonia-lyase [Oscillospiraceae bacterium]|nr:D-serine ammonia-lyase [Oscillospiraceae bacterium]